jgi:hypothetical protein
MIVIPPRHESDTVQRLQCLVHLKGVEKGNAVSLKTVVVIGRIIMTSRRTGSSIFGTMMPS